MTRDEAIAYGKEQLEIFGGLHKEYIQMAIETLEQTQWIPCSERQPKTLGNYLVTTAKGNVWCARWDALGWAGPYKTVIAWMPMPESWKGEYNEQIH